MKTIEIPDPNDSWVQVELYRWQYGKLPLAGDTRPLNIAEGLFNMAKAINDLPIDRWPTPTNIVSVLRYVSKILSQTKQPKPE